MDDNEEVISAEPNVIKFFPGRAWSDDGSSCNIRCELPNGEALAVFGNMDGELFFNAVQKLAEYVREERGKVEF